MRRISSTVQRKSLAFSYALCLVCAGQTILMTSRLPQA